MRLPGKRVRGAMFPANALQWAGPLLAAAVTAGLVALIVVMSGILDLSASTPHPQGWARLLHYTFKRSTAAHAADIAVPANFGSDAEIAKGATYYGMACSHCHGGPGLGQNPVALSMTPRPQYLVREVSTFTDRELFWIVKHGVKYSGMPAFPVQDRDDEMWSVVSFLRRMPAMSAAQYRSLAYGDALKSGTMNPGGTDNVAGLPDAFARGPYVLPHSDEPPRDQYAYARPAIGFDAFSIDGDVVKTCARCHTDNGAGRAGGAIPNIAILDPAYLRGALHAYAAGQRHSGFMQPVATQLSDDQMTALARYYTTQPRHRPDAPGGDAATLALGQRIAAVGLGARGIGACSSCHDITRASARAFPAIDGQHRAYLRGRILQFRGQPYPVPGGNPMIAIAKKLTRSEIAAVTAYYASRAPIARKPVLPAS